MKRSEKSSPHRRNSNLLKELKYEPKPYKPTPRSCKKWFNILNQQLFGNKLPPVNEMHVTFLWDDHGNYTYYSPKDPLYPRTKITLDDIFINKKVFVEVLAHEMIHHFQFIHYEPMGHGPTFEAWRDNLDRKSTRLNSSHT